MSIHSEKDLHIEINTIINQMLLNTFVNLLRKIYKKRNVSVKTRILIHEHNPKPWNSTPPLPSFALLLSQLVIFVYTLLKLWLEFLSLLRIFHSFRDVSIAVERLQMLTYVQHLWPLSSGGSLACHTYCSTGHPRTRIITPNAERLAIELSLLND